MIIIDIDIDMQCYTSRARLAVKRVGHIALQKDVR